MKKSASKFYFKVVLTLLTTTVFAHQNLENRVDTLEKEMAHNFYSKDHQSMQTRFAPARPNFTEKNWWIFGGFLYWRPRVGGTTYAITSNAHDLPSYCGKREGNNFNWGQGLKGGVGYKTSHDEWDLVLSYTGCESRSASEVKKHVFHTIIPLNLRFDYSGPITHAKSTASLSYHTVDLEVARPLFLSEKSAIRPYLAIKGTTISLEQKVTYTNQNFDLETDLNSLLQGIGPRLGCDHRFFLSNRVSLYGDLSTAILYGHFHIKEKSVCPSSSLNIQNQNLLKQGVKDHWEELVYCIQTATGLEWNKPMHQQKQYLHFKIGYEMHYYSKANAMQRIYPFSLSPSRNLKKAPIQDLIAHGMTLEVRFDF